MRVSSLIDFDWLLDHLPTRSASERVSDRLTHTTTGWGELDIPFGPSRLSHTPITS